MHLLPILLSLVLAAPAMAQPAYQPGPGPVPAGASTVTATGGTTARSLAARAADVVNVLDFGAVADDSTVNNTAINAAIAALPSQGGTVYFPKSANCYKITSAITITNSNIILRGDGSRASCIDSPFQGNVIQFGNATTAINPINVGVEKIGFTSIGFGRTSGAAIWLSNTNGALIRDVECLSNEYICVDVDNVAGQTAYYTPPAGANQFSTHIEHIQCFTGYDCIRLGATGQVGDTWIVNSTGSNQTNAGIELLNASGVYITNDEMLGNNRGLYAHPSSTTFQSVSSFYISNSYFDTSTNEGFLLDATGGGYITDNHADGLWVSTCGSAGNAVSCIVLKGGPVSGSSVLIKNNVFNINVLNAFGHGVDIGAGSNLQLSGNISGCGIAASSPSTSGYVGLLIEAGVSHWSWNGSIGGLTGLVPTNKQKLGVYVLAGASDYYIVQGDLSGNYTSGLSDSGTGTHKLVSGILQ